MVRTARTGAEGGSAFEQAARTAAPSKEMSKVERIKILDKNRSLTRLWRAINDRN
jgi:hypothetical protein